MNLYDTPFMEVALFRAERKTVVQDCVIDFHSSIVKALANCFVLIRNIQPTKCTILLHR
jgi:hypothetical protein